MKTNLNFPILGFTFLLFSCTKEVNKTVETFDNDTLTKVKTIDSTVVENEFNNDDNSEPTFPISGKTINDFVPKNYKIDLEADGDLNQDGLKDHVIFVIKANDSTAQRSAAVLLKQQDKSYKLDAKSSSIIEPKYREDGFLNYDYENISIDKKGQLVVTQQSTGANGSLESIFKYVDNKLILKNISTFNMGAGGQTELKLDLIKGIFEETNINTMDENMPSETTSKPYKPGKILFEDSDPAAIIMEAYK